MIRKPIASGIVLLFIVSSLIPLVSSDTSNSKRIIYVDDDGGADYTKIQDAIDNANDGDTIFVYSGTYYENVLVGKSITLQGEDRNTTIVDGGGVNDTILVNAEWVTVSNLGVTNSSITNFLCGGIHTKANYCIIKNNFVFKITQIGIIIKSNYNIISDNKVIESRIGIITQDVVGNFIINNVIKNITYNGINLASYSSKNSIYKNTVTHCNDGLMITDSNDNIVRENIADSNKMNGLFISNCRRNTINDNTFSNNNYGGIDLQSFNDNTIYNNNFINNKQSNYDWYGNNHWYFDYPIGGNYWDDYFNGSDNYHGVNQDILGGDGIWDEPYYISISLDIDRYPYVEPNGWMKEPDGADLDCLGILSWDSVKPNTEQTGRIILFNNGESSSLLDWEVEGIPDWGGCIVTPDSGDNLSPEDEYVPLTVTITSPNEQEQSFSGEIKIVNKENSSDYHIIPVSLTTAKTKEKTQKDRTYLISYNSYIDMEFNTTILDKPLEIGSHTLPINLSYWTNIPSFFRKIPYPINCYFLFGILYYPLQVLNIEVLNEPDWANIYISSPITMTDIPYESEEKSIIEFNLIISIKPEAPSEKYKLDLEVSCNQIKRLNGVDSYKESIFFTPK